MKDAEGTRPRKASRGCKIIGVSLLLSLIALTATHLLTRPPSSATFDVVKQEWKASEAWLYDRNGELLDSERVQFDRRKLAWVSLNDIPKSLQEAVVKNEDKRFWSYNGVDWIALAGAAKARWTGGLAEHPPSPCKSQPIYRLNWPNLGTEAYIKKFAKSAARKFWDRIGPTSKS